MIEIAWKGKLFFIRKKNTIKFVTVVVALYTIEQCGRETEKILQDVIKFREKTIPAQ